MDQNPNIKSLVEWMKNPKNKTVTRFILLFVLGLLMLSLGKLFTINVNEKKIFQLKTSLPQWSKIRLIRN